MKVYTLNSVVYVVINPSRCFTIRDGKRAEWAGEIPEGAKEADDNTPFSWTITTQMPSTGRITNQQEHQGTLGEYKECVETWQDEDCVSVSIGWDSKD